MKKFIREINDFYPEYLKAHSNKSNRALHFIGTTAFFALTVFAAVSQTWWLLALAVFCGYFFSGVGHHYLEKNESFRTKRALGCIISSGRMYLDTLTFSIGKKLRAA
ncbi:MAG: DUF962 domain-containing protein [Bacteroidia bacterium]|nr:DUF962 domain-containing protein [Bacteroidia bacterium]